MPGSLRSALVVLVLGCFAPGTSENNIHASQARDGLKILFVGNSLTYTNDLPVMLERLLVASGVEVSKVESEARPDFGLQDHWSSTRTMKTIDSGDWDVVIFQQGPSATEGRPSLIEYSHLFASRIRAAGAMPALYMVWPSSARLHDFPGVADSYRTASREIDGVLLPVGEAWMHAWMNDSKLRLYGRDGFHPSRLGTYLAALVMYQQFSGCDPRLLPAEVPGLKKGDPLDQREADVLQQAAVTANSHLQPGESVFQTSCSVTGDQSDPR